LLWTTWCEVCEGMVDRPNHQKMRMDQLIYKYKLYFVSMIKLFGILSINIWRVPEFGTALIRRVMYVPAGRVNLVIMAKHLTRYVYLDEIGRACREKDIFVLSFSDTSSHQIYICTVHTIQQQPRRNRSGTYNVSKFETWIMLPFVASRRRVHKHYEMIFLLSGC
jgi:hypothetical protein